MVHVRVRVERKSGLREQVGLEVKGMDRSQGHMGVQVGHSKDIDPMVRFPGSQEPTHSPKPGTIYKGESNLNHC